MTGGTLSHATVNDMFNGRRLISWDRTERVVSALGGSPVEFLAYWEAAHEEIAGQAIPDTPPNVAPVSTSAAMLTELRAIRQLLERMVGE